MAPSPNHLRNFLQEVCQWDSGVDMTGENMKVPPKHIRIPDSMADEYQQAGYLPLRQQTLVHGNSTKTVTLISAEAEIQRLLEQEKGEFHARRRDQHRLRNARTLAGGPEPETSPAASA